MLHDKFEGKKWVKETQENYIDELANSPFFEGKGSPSDKAFKLLDLEWLERTFVKSSGYVVDTLEAALWCFLNTNTYRDCVLTAVNLGEDTDTVAAVAGGLAGIYYGCGSESNTILSYRPNTSHHRAYTSKYKRGVDLPPL